MNKKNTRSRNSVTFWAYPSRPSMRTWSKGRGLMKKKSEERLLQLVSDYLGGNFTMQSEKPLIDEIISLVSPTLSAHDVFEVIFEGAVETPEEGVAALRTFAQTKYP